MEWGLSSSVISDKYNPKWTGCGNTVHPFYPSKEMLLFDVSQDFHAQVDSYDNHRKDDSDLSEGLFKELAANNGLSVEAVAGEFMMIIFGGMYKREIGEANRKESMRIVIRGIVIQLIS